jgi:hypothetical protein
MDGALFFWRMQSCISLDPTFNRLHDTKNDGQNQDKNRNPERIPLYFLSPIEPPLLKGFGLSLVENFLQYNQTIVPELEHFNVAVFWFQLATSGCVRV